MHLDLCSQPPFLILIQFQNLHYLIINGYYLHQTKFHKYNFEWYLEQYNQSNQILMVENLFCFIQQLHPFLLNFCSLLIIYFIVNYYHYFLPKNLHFLDLNYFNTINYLNFLVIKMGFIHIIFAFFNLYYY